LKAFTVTVHQTIKFEVKAEDEDEAKQAVIDGESWMPDHTGDSYDHYIECEETDGCDE